MAAHQVIASVAAPQVIIARALPCTIEPLVHDIDSLSRAGLDVVPLVKTCDCKSLGCGIALDPSTMWLLSAARESIKVVDQQIGANPVFMHT